MWKYVNIMVKSRPSNIIFGIDKLKECFGVDILKHQFENSDNNKQGLNWEIWENITYC